MNDTTIGSVTLISNNDLIISQVQRSFHDGEDVTLLRENSDVELISFELPELIIIDFTDWELGFTALDCITTDPWLHYQSVILISSSYDVERQIDGHRTTNLLAAISQYHITRDLPRILRVIRENSPILVHRGFEAVLFDEIQSTFSFRNSFLEMEVIINMICSYLFNANRIDELIKNRIKVTLTELITNAIEHGNCGITYGEKREWLETHNSIEELIEEKSLNSHVAEKRVTIKYIISKSMSTFVIEDKGTGFIWNPHFAPLEENETAVSGRGLLIALSSTSHLSYNSKGNVVTASIAHKELSSNTFPAVLAHLKPEIILAGETVIQEGERSDYLFFIVRGLFSVSVGGSNLEVELSPDDIFMGEMSFLLMGRRTATIKAKINGEILKINRREFVTVIRKFPHYSLFLARLLAHRVAESNKKLTK